MTCLPRQCSLMHNSQQAEERVSLHLPLGDAPNAFSFYLCIRCEFAFLAKKPSSGVNILSSWRAASEDRVERVKRREAMTKLDTEQRKDGEPPPPRLLLHGHPSTTKEAELQLIRSVAHTLIMGFKSLMYTLSSFGNTLQVRCFLCRPTSPPFPWLPCAGSCTRCHVTALHVCVIGITSAVRASS